MTDLQLLRQVFYARILLGDKVCDQIQEHDPQLWRMVYERLNPDAVGGEPETDPE